MDKPNILTPEQIEKSLQNLPGWTYGADKISKEFEFRDFVDSLSFINSMVAYFEIMDHHPDTTIMYSKVKFELTRFDAGNKVTDRDIEVATELEKNYKLRKQN